MSDFIWQYKDEYLEECENFKYLVEMNLYEKNSFTVLESRIFYCNEFINKIVTPQVFIHANFKLEKTTNLIAAPLTWLNENNYKKIENLSKSEKKKLNEPKNKPKNNNDRNGSSKSSK